MIYRKRFAVARTQEDGPRYVQGGVPSATHLWTKDTADAWRFEARETAHWVADQAGEGARVIEIFDFVDEEASRLQLEGICHEMLIALRIAEAMIDGPSETRRFLHHTIEQAEAILGIGDRP